MDVSGQTKKRLGGALGPSGPWHPQPNPTAKMNVTRFQSRGQPESTTRFVGIGGSQSVWKGVASLQQKGVPGPVSVLPRPSSSGGWPITWAGTFSTPGIGGSLCRVPNPLRYIGACSVRPGAVRSITVSMPLTAASRLLLTARKVSPC